MRELIGLTHDEAVAKVSAIGLNYVVIHNDSDKLKAWDTELVVKASVNGDIAELVCSRFLINIE